MISKNSYFTQISQNFTKKKQGVLRERRLKVWAKMQLFFPRIEPNEVKSNILITVPWLR